MKIHILLSVILLSKLVLMMADINAQKAAVKAWAKSLTEEDYDSDKWNKNGQQPQNYFDKYATKLSDLFLVNKALVNFALVGACDGTNDNTIRDRYLPNKHWRGVFVEPFEINFNDLSKFMETHGVLDRTHLIHAAATNKCNSTIIKMKRPDHEERNKSLPHWMRRQIGAVVPFDKLDRKMTGGWVAEFVRCVNGDEILTDWALALNKKQSLEDAKAIAASGRTAVEEQPGSDAGKAIKKVRPHVLKVDVEGHDYEVLMGFLRDETPQGELPLLINFEAKSLYAKFDLTKEVMIKRGYAVSNLATDGFALLRAEKIFSSKNSGGVGKGNKKKGRKEKKNADATD